MNTEMQNMKRGPVTHFYGRDYGRTFCGYVTHAPSGRPGKYRYVLTNTPEEVTCKLCLSKLKRTKGLQ